MSGILDSKSRIIDAILTSEGRRQIADGNFRVSYVTFTDADVIYLPSAEEGHVDPSSNIQLEACNLPQDQIVFEADDSGKLIPFRNQEIKVQGVTGFLTSSSGNVLEGAIADGNLVVFQRYNGRRIQTKFINSLIKDSKTGIVYTSYDGIQKANIFLTSSIPAGTIKNVIGSQAIIGIKGGLSSQDFAKSIAEAVKKISDAGGPKVQTQLSEDSVYLDVNVTGSFDDRAKIYLTGSISDLTASIILEENAIGGNIRKGEVASDIFASQIRGILTSSFDNFVDLRTIGSIDRFFEDETFELSNDYLKFDLSKIQGNALTALKDAPPTLNAIDSIFNDDKMSHLENFMYLPPIVKVSDSLVPNKSDINNLTNYFLGDYPSWGNNEHPLTFQELQTQLLPYEVKTPIVFRKTSNMNNVMAQFFEVSDGIVSKLDIVNFGEVRNSVQEETAVTDNVFFVGKVFLDNRGTACFVNMFTLIFSRLTDEQESLISKS